MISARERVFVEVAVESLMKRANEIAEAEMTEQSQAALDRGESGDLPDDQIKQLAEEAFQQAIEAVATQAEMN